MGEEKTKWEFINPKRPISAKEASYLIHTKNITTLPFTHIKGRLNLKGTSVTSLGKLQRVDGSLILDETKSQPWGIFKELKVL